MFNGVCHRTGWKGLKRHLFVGYGVGEREPVRVQRLMRQLAENLALRSGDAVTASIGTVPNDWVAMIEEVNSNLMGSTGLQCALHQSHMVGACQDRPMGDRLASFGNLGGEAFSIFVVPTV
jgi:hypothetical protein